MLHARWHASQPAILILERACAMQVRHCSQPPCTAERPPNLWNLLNKEKLYIRDVERLIPVVHRYGVTSLLLLDLIVIRLYSLQHC